VGDSDKGGGAATVGEGRNYRQVGGDKDKESLGQKQNK
jgi:hypothetical protein